MTVRGQVSRRGSRGTGPVFLSRFLSWLVLEAVLIPSLCLGHLLGAFFLAPVIRHVRSGTPEPGPASYEEGLAQIDLKTREQYLAHLSPGWEGVERPVTDGDRYLGIVVHPDHLSVHELGPGFEQGRTEYPTTSWSMPLFDGKVSDADKRMSLIEPLWAHLFHRVQQYKSAERFYGLDVFTFERRVVVAVDAGGSDGAGLPYSTLTSLNFTVGLCGFDQVDHLVVDDHGTPGVMGALLAGHSSQAEERPHGLGSRAQLARAGHTQGASFSP